MCLRVLEEGFKVLNHEHEVLRMHLKLESFLTKVTKLYMLQSHNGHVSLNIKNLTNIDRGQSWSKLWKKLCIFCYIYKLNRLPAKIAFKAWLFCFAVFEEILLTTSIVPDLIYLFIYLFI